MDNNPLGDLYQALKENPLPKRPVTTYLIWSNRHKEWWGPDRSGYTLRLEAAGRYTKEDAGDIVTTGLPGANVAVDTALANQFIGDADAIEGQIDFMKRL